MTSGINLLPANLQKQSIRRRVFRQWTVIMLLLFSVVLCTAFLHWRQCQRMSGLAVAQEPAADIVRQTMADIEIAETRIAALQSELSGLSGIRVSVDPLSVFLTVQEAISGCRDEVQLKQLQLINSETETTASVGSNAAILTSARTESEQLPMRESTIVTITGQAQSDLSIARVTGALRDAGIFHSVTLVSAEPAGDESALRRSFCIRCVRREATP